MKKKITILGILLPALCFLLFPAAAQLPSPLPDKTPLFIQLNKNYFTEGDTLLFSLQALSGDQAWYLLEIYEGKKVERISRLAGQLENGLSAARLPLPEEMEEGVYWARFLLDGGSHELLLPFYVFNKPVENEPEAHYPYQLKLSLADNQLLPFTENIVSFELWPPAFLAGGRIIIKDAIGAVFADTLLNGSGKGAIHFSPDAGGAYSAEVWLEEAKIAEAVLPEVKPVFFEWKISESSLTLRYTSEDSLQSYRFLISGPEGFRHEVLADPKKELVMDRTSWPAGEYILTLQSGTEPVLEETVCLGRRKPALWLADNRLSPKSHYLLNGRLDAIPEAQKFNWHLRVLSAHQENQLIKPASVEVKKDTSGAGCLNQGVPFYLRQLQQKSLLDPSKLQGLVRDNSDIPFKGAIVSLVGKGFERPYYTMSDEKGLFSFSDLPISGEERYLLAFPPQGNSLLSTSVVSPAAPQSFPAVEVDTFYLKKAKAYTEKHFFLQLLGKEEKAPKKEGSAASLPLSVPGEWINTFKTGDYINFQDMSEFMREAVPGLRVRYENGRSYMQVLNIFNSQTKVYYKGEPLYMINGYPLLNADSLLSINFDLVDSVQLVRKNASFYYGRIAQFGIVAVYTKPSEAGPLLPKEGTWLQAAPVNEGFSLEQAVSSLKENKMALPQLNGLIQWKENLQVQADGSFSFDLDTSDETGEFIVEVTAVSPDGQVIRLEGLLYVAPSVTP